jgi:hypothetical protein
MAGRDNRKSAGRIAVKIAKSPKLLKPPLKTAADRRQSRN